MDELMRRISANDFAEIEGLQVTGTLPVRQDIVNEIVTSLLQNTKTGGTPGTPPPSSQLSSSQPSGAAGSGINWWKLVDRLDVQLSEGKLILGFELRR